MAVFSQVAQDAITASPVHVGTENFNRALLTPEVNGIRVRWDGVDPTATIGVHVFAGGSIVIEGYDRIKRTRIIAVNATSNVGITLEW